MIDIIIFILGILIGSFLNVCIYRIPREENISFPPSHCTSCKGRIKWYDLIPVISYMALGGKCRKCGERISIRYPCIELATGVIFVALYLKYGLSFEFIKFTVLSCIMIVIGMIDYDTTDVYFNNIVVGLVFGAVFAAYSWYTGSGIMEYVYGALLGGGLISVIILLSHGMGWGDAEICLVCGAFLGFKLTIVMLFLSFVIGGAFGVMLILLKKKSSKDYIPFGPYIAFAAIITVFFGNEIIAGYLSYI